MTEQRERQTVLADLADEYGFKEEAESLRGAATMGKAYLFRTLGEIRIGRVVGVTRDGYILNDSAWVADTGVRWGEMLANGFPSEAEIEVEGDGIIMMKSHCLALIPWHHELPKTSQ